MSVTTLLAFLISVSFAAGLNMYATLACLGIVAHAGWLQLPPQLQLLVSLWIIVPAILMFAIEVFADRIPVLGLAWNAGHMFLRAPLAALIAFQATAQLSLPAQLGVALCSAVIATIAHGSKSLARAAAAEEGVPLPSIATNGAAGLLAPTVTLAAVRHPLITATLVLCSMVGIILFIRTTYQAIAHEAAALSHRCRSWWRERAARSLDSQDSQNRR